MAISDYTNGRVITTVPIGRGVDGAGYDPVMRDAYASNVDGTLTVIHQDTPDKYHVVENVQTAQGGRNMGLDPPSHRIYVVSANSGRHLLSRPRPTLDAGLPYFRGALWSWSLSRSGLTNSKGELKTACCPRPAEAPACAQRRAGDVSTW